MLLKLRELDLVGALLQDSVWIVTDAEQADNMDVCCFGTHEGGAETVPSLATLRQTTHQVTMLDRGVVLELAVH
jgi:hypothetical protein